MSVKESIWAFFKGKGLTDEAVAGIMGNVAVESNFSPTAYNYSSGAFGIFQWLGSRYDSLLDYASGRNTSASDLDTQLNYAWEEMQTTEKRTLEAMQSDKYTTAGEYAEAFETTFERSGGQLMDRRKNEAEKIYTEFNGNTAEYTEQPKTYTSNNMGLKWWGDVVRVVLLIGLLLIGVGFVYLAIIKSGTVEKITDIGGVISGNE